jgi:hypothetical protein
MAAPGLATCVGRLGLTSGGNELLLDMDLTEQSKYRGAVPGEIGTGWTANFAQRGILLADFFSAGHLYFTVTATGTNLGNGSVTNFTTGFFFLQLDLEVSERFVYGV